MSAGRWRLPARVKTCPCGGRQQRTCHASPSGGSLQEDSRAPDSPVTNAEDRSVNPHVRAHPPALPRALPRALGQTLRSGAGGCRHVSAVCRRCPRTKKPQPRPSLASPLEGGSRTRPRGSSAAAPSRQRGPHPQPDGPDDSRPTDQRVRQRNARAKRSRAEIPRLTAQDTDGAAARGPSVLTPPDDGTRGTESRDGNPPSGPPCARRADGTMLDGVASSGAC